MRLIHRMQVDAMKARAARGLQIGDTVRYTGPGAAKGKLILVLQIDDPRFLICAVTIVDEEGMSHLVQVRVAWEHVDPIGYEDQ